MKGAGINPEEKPVTGQDATVAGLQRILAGQQYMTIYKAITPEAEIAAEFAIALAEGEEVPQDKVTEEIDNGAGKVPSVALEPIAVTKDNVKSTVIADGFVTAAELCTSAYAKACKEAGISRLTDGRRRSAPRARRREQAIRPGPGSGPGRLRRPRGRSRRPRRRQRRRQVDDGEDDRRHPRRRLRDDPLRRRAGLDLEAPGRRRPGDRDRLPGPGALRQPRRRRQPLPRARGGLARPGRVLALSSTRRAWSTRPASCSRTWR